MIEERGRFEHEATERTEMDLVLCSLGYLLLSLRGRDVSRRGGFLFVSFASFAVTLAAQWHDESALRVRRFLSDERWIAEPDRCTEPPFAFGTGALEFWNFDESRLGGR